MTSLEMVPAVAAVARQIVHMNGYSQAIHWLTTTPVARLVTWGEGLGVGQCASGTGWVVNGQWISKGHFKQTSEESCGCSHV